MRQLDIYDYIPRSKCFSEVCGNEIEKPAKFKPRKYCSDECANYAKFKDALEKAIIKIHPTEQQKSLIRGDMFRLANILSKKEIA